MYFTVEKFVLNLIHLTDVPNDLPKFSC